MGASNGSTTAVDYTVHATRDPALDPPAALVFLTGGSYTEAQYSLDDERAVFEPLPLLFVFSTAERAWSVQFQKGAPSTWQFAEYDPGAHGTAMFDVQPGAIDDVAEFLASAL